MENDEKPKIKIVVVGDDTRELTGRLLSACIDDTVDLDVSRIEKKTVRETIRELTSSDVKLLMLLFDKLAESTYGETLRDEEVLILKSTPCSVDNTFYPKKNPNSYSEVQKKQAFFKQRKRSR